MELPKVLRDIYLNKTRFCVIFISKYYTKFWPNNVERPTILERFFKTEDQYLIPIRLDNNAWLDGLPETVGYIPAKDRNPEIITREIVSIIGLGGRPKSEHDLFEWLCRDNNFLGHFLVCFQNNIEHEWYKWDGDTTRMWNRYVFGKVLQAHSLGTMSTNLIETSKDVILFLKLTKKGERLLNYIKFTRSL